jgi:hypothetical protein
MEAPMAEKTQDSSAPATLTLEIRGSGGEVWGTIVASSKEFKTGSVGFYGSVMYRF